MLGLVHVTKWKCIWHAAAVSPRHPNWVTETCDSSVFGTVLTTSASPAAVFIFLRVYKFYLSAWNVSRIRACDWKRDREREFATFKSWWSAARFQSTMISFLPLMFSRFDSHRKLLPTEQVHTEQVGSYVGTPRVWSCGKPSLTASEAGRNSVPEHDAFSFFIFFQHLMHMKELVQIQNFYLPL